MIGIIASLAPGFFEKTLRINATDASYIVVIPLGFGIVIGGMILGKIGDRLIRRRLVSRAILFSGLLFFFEGISPIFSPAIRYFHIHPKPLSFLTQLPLSTVLIAGSFLLGVAMGGLSLIPVLLSGFLADVFGTTPIFIGIAGIIILIGVFGLSPSWFFSKESLPLHVREFLGLGHWEKR